MAVRGTRFLGALTAGGILTGSLLLGAGSALAQTSPTPVYPEPSPAYTQTAPGYAQSAPAYAQPAPTGTTVPAQCGQTVAAAPGDQVLVTPLTGVPFTKIATAGMDPITKSLGGVLCQVDVSVMAPATTLVQQVAPEPLRSTVGQVTGGARSALNPAAKQAPAPMMAPAPMFAPMAPVAAPAMPLPAMTPQQLAAGAPMFAPAFASLPSSFLRDALAPGAEMPAMAPAGRMMDPALLFGSAFPGLRAGAPAYLGYDPASAVTTASQVQALPVDGLPSSGGIGLPVLMAVLVLAGVAAFAVRRSVIGSRTVTAAGPAAAPAAVASASAAPAKLATPVTPAKPAAAPIASDAEKTTVTDAEKTAVTDLEKTVIADVERTTVTPRVPATI